MRATSGVRHLPFSSVVGQDDAKLALVLAAMEPRLGGVLLRGDKGSAKTTLARGLAAILPGGAPFVELPLGASEDRVLGSIDLAALLEDRAHAFRSGLLASAHGGVLYVDEINLLPDHLVDSLLDVAVSGVNRVERDGFSESHPARFVLVGSMNPEEGELRPQLLDRFGLTVEVRAPADPDVRAEVVRRQLALDSSTPSESPADTDLRQRLGRSTPVPCSAETLIAASRLAVAMGAEGLRADLALCRAAGALAGWEGRDRAHPDDLRVVAHLVLGHRRRRQPFDAPGISSEQLSEALDQAIGDPTGRPPQEEAAGGPGGEEPDPPRPDGPPGGRHQEAEGAPGTSDPGSSLLPPDPAMTVPLPAPRPGRRTAPRGTARRGGGSAAVGRGRPIGHEPLSGSGQRLDPAATTVSHVVRTGGEGGLRPGDLRAVVAREAQPRLIIVAVDASGSMAARQRLEAARSAVLALLGDAYRRRDRVAMVIFRGDTAEVVLRPTASVEIAKARLAELPSGGRTPLAAGLNQVTRIVRASDSQGGPSPVAVIITDGRATAGDPDPVAASRAAAAELAATGASCLVIDAETGPVRLGLARSLASSLSAEHVTLEDLRAARGEDGLADAIRARIGAA